MIYATNQESSKMVFNKCLTIAASIVSILSILVTILLHFRQDEKIKQMQGAVNRPILRVLNTPKVYSISGKSKKPIPTKTLKEAVNKEEFIHIDVSLTLETKITVKNEGNSIARLLVWGLTDRATGDAHIRSELLDAEKRKKWKIHRTDEYYKTLSILPGGEHTFNLSCTIHEINKNKEFTLHYYFLYKDELNNICDSYYWARYATEEFRLNSEGIKKACQFKDTHFDTKMYFDKKSKSISSFINNVLLEQEK